MYAPAWLAHMHVPKVGKSLQMSSANQTLRFTIRCSFASSLARSPSPPARPSPSASAPPSFPPSLPSFPVLPSFLPSFHIPEPLSLQCHSFSGSHHRTNERTNEAAAATAAAAAAVDSVALYRLKIPHCQKCTKLCSSSIVEHRLLPAYLHLCPHTYLTLVRPASDLFSDWLLTNGS